MNEHATATPFADAHAEPDGTGFLLVVRGRCLRTPARNPLLVPTWALADALAAEWRAQGPRVDREALPLNRLAATAIDRVAPARREVIDHLLSYAATDTVCYRAASPETLVARQSAAWQPLLDWLQATHGVRLTVTTGLMPVAQEAAALAGLRTRAECCDDFTLTALALAAQATGSFVVALALIEGVCNADQAFAAAIVDEDYQAGRWGRDAEAERRRSTQRAEIQVIARFLSLLRERAVRQVPTPAHGQGEGGGTMNQPRDA